MNILIIEDSPSVARMLSDLINDYSGFFAIGVGLLSAAKAALDGQEKIDAIILDLGLPDSSAQETVEWIPQVSGSIPIIILTGHNNQSLVIKAIENGAQGFILKGDLDGEGILQKLISAKLTHSYQNQMAEANRTCQALINKVDSYAR